MDRRAKVELFEKIRQGYTAGKTIRQLAKEHEVHRRMVSRVILEPPFKPKRIVVPPPWEGAARDAAE